MEMQRCPVCGWPTPKGRPCPRGCAATATGAPPARPTRPASPVKPGQPAAVGQPAQPAPVVPQPVYTQTAYAPPEPVPAQAPPAVIDAASDDVAAVAGEPSAHPESRRARKRTAGPSGIGGWLILPVIGLLGTLGWSAWNLVRDLIPLFGSEEWSQLTTPGSPAYHYLWQPWVLFDTFALIVMVLAPIALLTLIFRKRRSTPRWMITFYVFCIVAMAVDAGIGLLVMVHWLRAAGLSDPADALYTVSLRNLCQVLVLAVIWIPYFWRSRRVKKTFVNPQPLDAVDPAYFMAAAEAKRGGRGRVRAALAVAAIIVIAGGAVFALNTFESSATADAGGTGTVNRQGSQFIHKAETALSAGNAAQALMYYDQALQADPGFAGAYYGKWNVLVKQSTYVEAQDVATQATKKFPTSRVAWFELGFAQESLNELPAAVASYAKSLQLPQDATATGTPIDDAAVRKRLDLVRYVVAITAPRQAIAGAIAQVDTALQGTTLDKAAVSTATSRATTILDANIATLEQVQPPAYFADFNASMLSGYRDLKTACAALATAAASSDAAALTSAETGLNKAVDHFNANDKQGSSLMQSYYAS